MAREGITYKEVESVCVRLMESGIKPTQRNVRAELGTGSISTILRHLNDWKNNQSVINNTDIELPSTVVSAMKGAMVDAVNLATYQLETQLVDAKKQVEEDIKLLVEHEGRNQQLERQLVEEKDLAENKELELQKRLAAESKQVESLQTQNQTLSEKLDASVRAQEIARTESAKAQLQVERADKATQKAEKRTEELTEEAGQVKSSLVMSQREAATASAVSGEQAKSIKRLESELAGCQTRYEDLLVKHEQIIKSESAAKSRLDVLELVQRKGKKK